MTKFKYNIGDLCCYDINNINKNKEGDTPYILQIVGRRKRAFKKIYRCLSSTTAKIYDIEEKLITPFSFRENNIFVRYPEDSPSITVYDVVLLESISNILCEKIDNKDSNIITDIKALIAKLNYYVSRDDV